MRSVSLAATAVLLLVLPTGATVHALHTHASTPSPSAPLPRLIWTLPSQADQQLTFGVRLLEDNGYFYGLDFPAKESTAHPFAAVWTYLTAVEAATGHVVWNISIGKWDRQTLNFVGRIGMGNGMIFVPGRHGPNAYDQRSGKLMWASEPPNPVSPDDSTADQSYFYRSDSELLHSFGDSNVRTFNASSGEQISSIPYVVGSTVPVTNAVANVFGSDGGTNSCAVQGLAYNGTAVWNWVGPLRTCYSCFGCVAGDDYGNTYEGFTLVNKEPGHPNKWLGCNATLAAISPSGKLLGGSWMDFPLEGTAWPMPRIIGVTADALLLAVLGDNNGLMKVVKVGIGAAGPTGSVTTIVPPTLSTYGAFLNYHPDTTKKNATITSVVIATATPTNTTKLQSYSLEGKELWSGVVSPPLQVPNSGDPTNGVYEFVGSTITATGVLILQTGNGTTYGVQLPVLHPV